tara:strand:+ start:17058 stop:17381 length:324 start_codon:yes stop_codon:yes gene_type:complete
MSTPKQSSVGRILVQIPAGLDALIPSFLERRQTDVKDLATALERDDFSTIEILGHRMKGNGASMGFAPISRIGDALELAAPAADREQIQALTIELRDYLGQVDVVYG